MVYLSDFNDAEFDGLPCGKCGKQIPVVTYRDKHGRVRYDRGDRVDCISPKGKKEAFHAKCYIQKLR